MPLRFRLNVIANTFVWSEALFRLHGFSPGEVVPSVELLLAHKHPEDRPRAAEIIADVSRVGGYFCLCHRIIDSRGHVRRVLTCGEGILDRDGQVTALSGVMTDLTATVHRETERAARDAIAGATASRTVIGQAQGILMGRLGIGAAEALRILMDHSSRTNVKLARVAADLVHVADSTRSPDILDNLLHAMQGSDGTRPSALQPPQG